MLDFNIYRYPVSPNYYGNLRKIYKDLKYLNPRKYYYVSRYKNTKNIEDNISNISYQETYKNVTIPKSDSDRYVTINSSIENRLDIIANKVYGYPSYWWIIAIANNIIDPFNIPIGTVLRIPPLISLYSKGSVLE